MAFTAGLAAFKLDIKSRNKIAFQLHFRTRAIELDRPVQTILLTANTAIARTSSFQGKHGKQAQTLGEIWRNPGGGFVAYRQSRRASQDQQTSIFQHGNQKAEGLNPPGIDQLL
jgi:hypothetical protein